MNLNGFERHDLGGGHSFWSGQLPEAVVYQLSFAEVWDLHPPKMPEILIHGRRVRIPRWQQAYGVDYRFSGQVSTAQPVPQCLEALLAWCRVAIDPRLNGLLLNWYDGQLGHYIGRHRNSTRNLVPSSGIVTVSLGEERV